jgi:muramoyltetrapeptide carboxypeptidase
VTSGRKRIGVVAPSTRLTDGVAEAVTALAAELYGERAPEIRFHPQCWFSYGHFAGDDNARAEAFLEVANDPACDALWFARGGYGCGRLIERVLPRLTDAARAKAYLGYSDAGAMLSALHRNGFGGAAHGPMPNDVLREGGRAAAARSLRWLAERDPAGLEPSLKPGLKPRVRPLAFNMAILSSLIGTPWEPDFEGRVVMLEEVGEYMYRIDRFLFHITGSPRFRTAAGLMLGRCSAVPENDPDFGRDEEEIAREWCERSGVPYLGRADIGHDGANKIVPFDGV